MNSNRETGNQSDHRGFGNGGNSGGFGRDYRTDAFGIPVFDRSQRNADNHRVRFSTNSDVARSDTPAAPRTDSGSQNGARHSFKPLDDYDRPVDSSSRVVHECYNCKEKIQPNEHPAQASDDKRAFAAKMRNKLMKQDQAIAEAEFQVEKARHNRRMIVMEMERLQIRF